MRQVVWLSLLAATIGACGGGGTAPRDYQIRESVAAGAPAIPVRITVPKAWKEEVDKMGGPTFELVEGHMFPHFAVLVVGCTEPGPACVDKRIAVEWGDEKRDVQKQGAVTWVVQPNAQTGGSTEMRYVLDEKTSTIVKCVLMRGKDDDVTPLRAACDSLVVRP